MKVSHFAAVSLSLLLICKPSHSQPPKLVAHQQYERFPLRFDNANADDQIIALARAEDTNLIADARRFAQVPQDAELLSSDSMDFFNNHLNTLAYQRYLTWAKVGVVGSWMTPNQGANHSDVFVLWSDQDISQVAHETLTAPVPWIDKHISQQEWDMAAAAKRPMDYFDDPNAMAQRTREVGPSLIDYLEKVQGWDGKTTDYRKQIPVAELPQPLRDNLLARLQALAFLPVRINGDSLWFDDAFWQHARLWVSKVRAFHKQGELQTSLQVISRSNDDIVRAAFVGWIDMTGTGVRLGYVPTGQRLSTPVDWHQSDYSPRGNFGSLRQVGLAAEKGAPPNNIIAAPPVVLDAKPEAPSVLNDLILQNKVSFEVKRQPLSEVLRAIGEQGKVVLSIGNGAEPTLPLTARVHDLSLGEVMRAIERLYSGQWQKMGDASYQLNKGELSNIGIKFNQLGDMGQYHYWYNEIFFYRAPKQLNLVDTDWAAEVLPYIPNPAQLVNAKVDPNIGVPLTTLPPELQAKIRQTVLARVSPDIVNAYFNVTPDNLAKAVLRIKFKPLQGDFNGFVPGQRIPAGADFEDPQVSISAPGYPTLKLDVNTLFALANPPVANPDQIPNAE